MKKVRGRPRKYDEDKVLNAAEQVFWAKGFSATSMDDLAMSMEMNRPSIYRAFGDKQNIYRKVLVKVSQNMEQAYNNTMLVEGAIHDRLANFFLQALTVYTSGLKTKGCLIMSTAPAAANIHPDIQHDLLKVIQDLDCKLTEQFQRAIASAEIQATVDAKGRSLVAQSLLHSLSLRARAGDDSTQLTKLIESGISLVTA